MPLITLRQKMCKKAVEEGLWWLHAVPDRFKNQEMCKAVEAGPYQLKDVPDWFVTQQIDVWHDDDYCCHEDEILK